LIAGKSALYAVYTGTDAKKEEKMASDAIVLWGLLLVYGIPIVTVAYWMEKMMHKGEDDE
jgi:hypothetical protein